MLMMKFTGAGFSASGVSAGGDVSDGLAMSVVRVSRFVATMRQLVGAQRKRKPGASVSADSFGASASSLNSPSPQRTALES